jgi:hypothetical protein
MQQTRIRHWYLHYELKVSTILTMDEMPHSRVVYQHYILVGLQWWQCGHLPKLRVGLHIREDFFFLGEKEGLQEKIAPQSFFPRKFTTALNSPRTFPLFSCHGSLLVICPKE